MIEYSNGWVIVYHTAPIDSVKSPRAIGWSWAEDTAAYKDKAHHDAILVHVECRKSYGDRAKLVLYILEHNISIVRKYL